MPVNRSNQQIFLPITTASQRKTSYTVVQACIKTIRQTVNILAGRYEIIEQLGGGGFAFTYRAKDLLQPSQPECVVKQLHPHQNHPRVLEFFTKEAEILERLGKHPQIPQLLAHFTENQNFYIVQEFIPGQDLSKEIIYGKPLSEDYVTKLLQDTLEVLSFVHSQGVIHRDIKPQNLMRRRQDGKICLIDFGAVKEVGTIIINSQGVVTSSIVIGSSGYMPREQTSGKPILASDIYALGITAIQALTGIFPNELEEDPQTGEIIWRHQAEVSDNLAEVLTKMIRRHYSLRYPSAKEALAALTSAKIQNTVLVNPAREVYLEEAKNRGQQGQGQFSVFALRILEAKRIELGLSESEAQNIQAEVLQIYWEYERKLQEYEQALILAVKQEYPFSPGTEKDLQDYRQVLGLREEDINVIESRVLPGKKIIQSESQAKITFQPAKPQAKIESQPQKPQVEEFLGIPVQSFEFETAKIVLNNGFLGLNTTWEIQRSRKRAKFFTKDLGNGVILEMVAIPGGTFMMGSLGDEEGRNSSESPQHQVSIPPFFMGKYPITQKQWSVVATLPKVKRDLKSNPSRFQGENRPVERVSWYDAQEFCARLSQRIGKNYRLPSEAEWEYACRGETTTPFYCGGIITTDLANYDGNYVYGNGVKGEYRGQTTDVGILPANPYGLHDMCGNVWEWCEDGWHTNYVGAPSDGKTWISGNNNRVLRGGSWYSNPKNCRSAYRSHLNADYSGFYIGFRVAYAAARI